MAVPCRQPVGSFKLHGIMYFIYTVDLGAVEFRRLTESNFLWSRSRRLTSQAAVEFFSAPPPSHLVSSFSTQSLNFSVRLLDQTPDVGF